MKKFYLVLVSALIIAAMLVPTGSKAAKGWLLSGALGAGIPSDSGKIGSDVETGFAEYLDIGYGFNKYITVGGYFGSDMGKMKASGADNVTWVQPYLGIYGRGTLPVGDSLEPYVDLGLGGYMFSAAGNDLIMYSKSPTFGLKLGGGLNWFLGKDKKWFIGPEIAYHWVNYDQDFRVVSSGTLKDYYQHLGMSDSFDVKVDGDANVFEVLFKFGYQWKTK